MRKNKYMRHRAEIRKCLAIGLTAAMCMAMLAGCDYLVALKPGKVSEFRDRPDMEQVLADFVAQPEILVTKKTKRSEKQVDIKPNIYYLSSKLEAFEEQTGQAYGALCLDTEEYQPVFYCQLTAGSVLNIKPELVMQALCRFVGTEYDPLDYQIHRLEMYGDENGKKGEIHLLHDEIPCQLVPLSSYHK